MKSTSVNVNTTTFSAIISIIIGLVMLAMPSMVISSIITILGWGLILWGGIPIVISLIKKLPIPTVPVAMLVVGVLVLIFASFLIKALVWVFGLIMILAAVQQLNMLNDMKKQGYIVKYYQMIYPAILLLLGVLTFINPWGSVEAVVMLFGCSSLFFGVTTLLSKALTSKNNSSNINN